MTAGPDTQSADGLGVPSAGISRWTDLTGPVRYLDFGGPPDGPVIVCVHGLGGSAVNWTAIAPLLTGTCRVLAPDLAGHGLTQSLGRGTDVASNRALLHRFIRSAADGPVILMGNSMGGMISLLEASAAPASVAGLVLLDPALPVVAARPDPIVTTMFALYLTPGLRRVVQSRAVRRPPTWSPASCRLCCADPSLVPADVIARHVEVASPGRVPGYRARLRPGGALGRAHRGLPPRPGLPAADRHGHLPGAPVDRMAPRTAWSRSLRRARPPGRCVSSRRRARAATGSATGKRRTSDPGLARFGRPARGPHSAAACRGVTCDVPDPDNAPRVTTMDGGIYV